MLGRQPVVHSDHGDASSARESEERTVVALESAERPSASVEMDVASAPLTAPEDTQAQWAGRPVDHALRRELGPRLGRQCRSVPSAPLRALDRGPRRGWYRVWLEAPRIEPKPVTMAHQAGPTSGSRSTRTVSGSVASAAEVCRQSRRHGLCRPSRR